jgi:large subunit ribosomal protein L9
MEVILRDHVEHLGKRGEIVKVADGYARNFLLPRKLALPATDANKKWVERERKIAEARDHEEKSAADAIATRLSALELTIARKTGENDQLYGSVTNADIAEVLAARGFEIDRRKILLPDQSAGREHGSCEAASGSDRAAARVRDEGRIGRQAGKQVGR